MSNVFDRLVPQPRSLVRGSGVCELVSEGDVCIEGAELDVRPARERLATAMGAGWHISEGNSSQNATIYFRIVPQVAGAQSYRLCITAKRVVAEAQDRAGLFYAAMTFAQLVRFSKRSLPICEIEDAPDFPVRGVMLDISRDKVPTMPTLYGLVDLFANLKINQLQLYTEHTFAYREHAEVWREASPMTADEIRSLDVYCHARCIELVPNQNSFGHFERWLSLPRYQCLAELPQGGAPLPWGGIHEKPTTLCPTDQRSVDFIAGLYDDLLPNFSSHLFNIGCDETFDLRGEGRSAARVKAVGEGRVYLDFIKCIHALVTARGRQMAFWGDIIIRYPELVAELPKDVVALEWGYEADHPFDLHGAIFAKTGLPFYVCPGTSSWNSLAGRTTNMKANLASAAVNGLKHGACGYLITDWGDGGHWQPLAVSYAGFVYGAGVAWGYAHNRDVDLGAALDASVADGIGDILLALGDVYLQCGVLKGNATELFYLLSKPRTRAITSGITRDSLHGVLEQVHKLADTVPQQDTVLIQETRQVIRLLRAACHRGIALLDGGRACDKTRQVLAREVDELMEEHARVWRLRNREGGLRDSLARMADIALK